MAEVYKVKAFWDGKAKVWVAEGVNVPGLCTEAATIQQLMQKLEVMRLPVPQPEPISSPARASLRSIWAKPTVSG